MASSGSIDLVGVWIAPADDLASQLVLSADANMDVTVKEVSEIPGETLTTAGGRLRTVLEEGDAERVGVDVSYADRPTRETLKLLRGQMLLYRDYRGRCWFGTILGLAAAERGGPGSCDLSFTLDRNTYSIEV